MQPNQLPSEQSAVLACIDPGDEVLVTLWGSVDADLRVMVDRSGRISIPRVGTIMVAGVRYGDLTEVISRRVGQVFRNYQISVSLGQIRSVRVYLTGYVKRPGVYTVGGLSSVVNALMRSGGPASAGSLRSIELRRGKDTITRYDLYDLTAPGPDPVIPRHLRFEVDERLDAGGIVVKAPDDADIERAGIAIERALSEDPRTAPYTRSAFAERLTGGFYLDITPRREEAARHGLAIADLNTLIETAIGGKECDVAGDLTIYELQALWLTEIVIAGGCLMHFAEMPRRGRTLPLAVEFGKAYDTTGFDIRAERVAELRSGQDSTLEVSDEEQLRRFKEREKIEFKRRGRRFQARGARL